MLAELGYIHYQEPTRSPRRLSRDDLLPKLRERHAAGPTLVWHQVSLENRALASAVKHVFGSWKQALIAVGLIDRPAAVHGERKL